MPRWHGTIHGVYPLLLIAAAAILGGVVVVAMGRGGEIALFRRDIADLRIRLRTPQDVALLRLPLALLGCSEPATADALRAIANLLAERDAEIASLRRQLAMPSEQVAAGHLPASDSPASDRPAGAGRNGGTLLGRDDGAAKDPSEPAAQPVGPS